MISKVTEQFQKYFGHPHQAIVRAPGRVNLLGEHVDYNDGFVMPAAIDRATYLAFSPSNTGVNTLVAADFGEKAVFTAENIASKTQVDGSALPEWAHYPAGVMWALAESGLPTPAIDAVYLSDVPRGSGLSSSASVEMAFALAYESPSSSGLPPSSSGLPPSSSGLPLAGCSLTPMQRALLGQKAENKYVGVNCGIMDQFASACGEKDRVLLLDCRSLEYKTLPLPGNVALVVADTTIRRKLTSGEYNARRSACEETVKILQQQLRSSSATPTIRSLRDISPEDFNRLAHTLPAELEKRSRHVVEEIARTITAQALLEAGDLVGFGKLMNECHASLRDLYEVSIPELDGMVEAAQKLPGCYGARLTGAGFGGCTINLVERSHVARFSEELAKAYQAQFNIQPEIYICQASNGAEFLEAA